jgi:diketogulonate reductase-like aldo/keto reductase
MDLPIFGLGTYKLTGDNCYEIVYGALKSGIRLIDTALLYKNHGEIGKAIKDSGIDRSEIFVTSKVHFRYIEKGTIGKSIEKILTELNLEYVDLLLLHSPNKTNNIKNWNDMIEIQKSGKCRFIGVSNFLISDLEQISSIGVSPYVNQIEYNPLCTRKELCDYCRFMRIKIQAYRSFSLGEVFTHDVIKSIADENHITIAQLVLYWSIKQGVHVIPMADNKTQYLENYEVLKILDMEVKGIEKMDKLNNDRYTMPKYRGSI